MKKFMTVFFMAAVFSVAYSSSYTLPSIEKPPVKASEVFLPVGKSGELISLMELSTISVKDFQKLSGKKMKFIDRLSFKLGQRQLKKSINPDGAFNKKKTEKFFDRYADGGGFHAGGFFLGLLLGLIGILIAYLIKDDKKKNRVKWAWIGWLVWLVILAVSLAA